MDEETKVPQSAEEGKQKGSLLKKLLRVLTLVITILLVVLAVLLVINRDQMNLDSLRRYMSYQALERGENGTAQSYHIDSERNDYYVALDDGMLVCANNRIMIYSDSGTVFFEQQSTISDPIIQREGNYTLVYDSGGRELCLFHDRQLTYQYTANQEEGLISANITAAGWLTVVEQASGYKAAVTVYDQKQNPIVTVNISSSFVMDAALSPSHDQLAVVTVGQEGMEFASKLTMYQVSDGTEQSSQVLSSDPLLAMRWKSDGLWIQELSGLHVLGQSEDDFSWRNEGLYLQEHSFNGDGYAVEYFSRYRSGSVGQIFTVNSQGQVLGSLDINEEVLSLSAAGRYVAVLTNSALTIYTQDLNEYAVLENDSGIVKAMMRRDGSVVMIMNEMASVYLP